MTDSDTYSRAEVKKRTIRAVLWLLIIGGLMGAGYWRQAQQRARLQERLSEPHTRKAMPPPDTAAGTKATVYRTTDADGQALLEVNLWTDGIMGTNTQVTVWSTDVESGVAAGEAVFQVFRDVDTQFSTWKPDSEISRLNATAHEGPVACSPRMWELILASREAYEVSDGGFDVTAGPLMRLWGFYKRRNSLPDAAELATAREKVGFDKLILDEAAKTVQFPMEGMALDFGGIAKGWALDLARAELERRGMTRAWIDLGGNIMCLDTPPPGRETYRFGIRHPRGGDDTEVRVAVTGVAIATSGDYERYVEIDGTRYAHIMDPRTGQPIRGMAAVTVLAKSGIASDIASTAIFVSPDLRESIMAHYGCSDALIIRSADDGSLLPEEYGAVWQTHDADEPTMPETAADTPAEPGAAADTPPADAP